MGGEIHSSDLPVRPEKPSGKIPTIVIGTSLTTSLSPITAGFPSNFRLQSLAPIKVTG